MGRNISYANLDGGSASDNDEYSSEQDPEEEEEFRPSKRSRGQMGFRQKSSSYSQSSNKVCQFIWNFHLTLTDKLVGIIQASAFPMGSSSGISRNSTSLPSLLLHPQQ